MDSFSVPSLTMQGILDKMGFYSADLLQLKIS